MRQSTAIVTALSGALLIVTLILTYVLPLHYKGGYFDTAEDLHDCWQYSATGQPVDPEHLEFTDDSAVISASLEGGGIRGRSLCFVSRNVVFTIYADDVEIYDFHPN